jgi:hypothetical protein
MDNASWHRDLRVPALCARFKVLLIYLPPYSPDYNPIEAYFHDCEACIRRTYQNNGGDGQNDTAFKEFLANCAIERGNCFEAIRGHYRQARVPFREDEDEVVDYATQYSEQLQELQRWWVAQGFVDLGVL